MQIGEWLHVVRVQERERGVSHRQLASDPLAMSRYAVARLDDASCAIDSLMERIPSVSDPDDILRLKWETYRQDFIDQLLGVMDHLGALLTAASCGADDLVTRYTTTEQPSTPEVDTSTEAEPTEDCDEDCDELADCIADLPKDAVEVLPLQALETVSAEGKVVGK